MLREIRALRSAYQLVETESRVDTLVAVVTVAAVIGPLLLSWRESDAG